VHVISSKCTFFNFCCNSDYVFDVLFLILLVGLVIDFNIDDNNISNVCCRSSTSVNCVAVKASWPY
jgi:hypothetical protein